MADAPEVGKTYGEGPHARRVMEVLYAAGKPVEVHYRRASGNSSYSTMTAWRRWIERQEENHGQCGD